MAAGPNAPIICYQAFPSRVDIAVFISCVLVTLLLFWCLIGRFPQASLVVPLGLLELERRWDFLHPSGPWPLHCGCGGCVLHHYTPLLVVPHHGQPAGECNMHHYTGFIRSWKTWKSHGILKWSFPGLEKSWKKLKSQKVWKSHGNLLNSHVYLRRV